MENTENKDTTVQQDIPLKVEATSVKVEEKPQVNPNVTKPEVTVAKPLFSSEEREEFNKLIQNVGVNHIIMPEVPKYNPPVTS